MGETPLDQGIRAARLGNFEEALRQYERAIASGGDLALAARGHRAWLFRSLGQYDRALEDYRLLMEAQPQHEEPLVRYAETLLQLGRADESLRALAPVLHANPLNPLATDLLIRHQEYRGLRPAAEVCLPSADTLHARPPLNRILGILEQDPTSYPGSSCRELGVWLHALVRLTRPRTVVEIGTLFGQSTLYLAQALEENGSGHLCSFDLFEHTSYRSPVPGVTGAMIDIVRGHLEAAGLAHRATLHAGDSSSTLIRQFPDAIASFDMVLIDGDHHIDGCLKDWQAVAARLAPNGLVLLHDTNPERSGWLGPRHLIDNLRRHAAEDYVVLDLPTPDGFGIGVIQKVGTGCAGTWKVSLREQLAEWFHDRRLRGRRT